VSEQEAATYAREDNIPLAMAGWVAGTLLVWSALFTVGNYLYGRMGYTMALGAVMVLSGSAVIWVTQRLWR
jgi:solute:Na+ symporter, SSS family